MRDSCPQCFSPAEAILLSDTYYDSCKNANCGWRALPAIAAPVKSLKSLGAVGVLRSSELPALSAGTRRVAELMRDSEWHSAETIKLAAGSDGLPASEGLRRLRELRDLPNVEIDRRRAVDGRLFEYRMRVSQ